MTEGNTMTVHAIGFVTFSMSLSVLMIAGCGSSEPAGPPIMSTDSHEEHEHGHAHPETLPEAIAELKELRDTVRDAFASNDEEAAHGPLHDVGHLLEEVNELAEKAGLSAEQQATIKSSTETLFDAFGAVDNTMHGQEGSTYGEVSEKIDAAIESLTAAANGATGDSAETKEIPVEANDEESEA